MTQIFLHQNIDYDDPAIFTTLDAYSMDTAIELMRKLDATGNYEFKNDYWDTKDYGSLVKKGIEIYFQNCVFKIMYSYEHIFIYRVSGNKQKYYEFCDFIKHMDFSDNQSF